MLTIIISETLYIVSDGNIDYLSGGYRKNERRYKVGISAKACCNRAVLIFDEERSLPYSP